MGFSRATRQDGGPLKLSRAQQGAALATVLGSSAFGTGFQCVPVMAVVSLVGVLALTHTAQDRADAAALGVALLLGLWGAYATIFGSGAAGLALSFAFAAALVLLGGLGISRLIRVLGRRYRALSLERSGGVMLFPVCVTALFSIISTVGPGGTWGDLAYAALGWDSLVQFSAVFGLDGINFALAWTASAVFSFAVMPAIERRVEANNKAALAAADLDASMSQLEDSVLLGADELSLVGTEAALAELGEEGLAMLAAADERRRGRRRSSLWCLGSAVVAALAVGGALQLNRFGKFAQRDIRDWDRRSINAVCLAGYEDTGTLAGRLNKTAEMASQALFVGQNLALESADLILWSETSVLLSSQAEEDEFFAGMRAIARETKTVIGFGYARAIPHTSAGFSKRNMFALILDNGDVAMRYQKVHPVVGVETDVEPGEHAAAAVETWFGTVSAAICFDFDFPNFIRTASTNAAIMLQPGWDWGPIGTWHARMDAMRAVENGFTLFRCSTGGVSGVYGPFGNVVAEALLSTDADGVGAPASAGYTAQIPLHGRQWTLYAAIGGALGYLCVMFWIFLVVVAFLPAPFVMRTASLSRWLEPVVSVEL